MKKMRVSKKGFTLTEIVLVIAVIVILSSASVIGIAATMNKAKTAELKLQAENGDNFEVVAWSKVNSIGEGLGGNYESPEYTPNIEEAKAQLDQAWQEMIDELKEQGYTDDDILITYDSEGYITDVKVKEKGSSGNSSSGGSSSGSSSSGDNQQGGNQPQEQPGQNQQGGNQPQEQPGQNQQGGNQPGQNQPGGTQNNNNGGSSAGGSTTVGNVTTSLPYGDKAGNGTKGIKNISGSGDKQTVTMTDLNGYNDQTRVSFTKNGNGTYGLSLENNQWVFQGSMPGFEWGKWDIPEMSNEQIQWFQDKYGITLG